MNRHALMVLACGLMGLGTGCKKGNLASSNGVPDLTLSGTGPGTLTQTAQTATETDFTLDFSNVEIGETRTLSLTLGNKGGSDYELTGVSGPTDPEYAQNGLIDGTDVISSVPFTVQFKPFTAGTKTDKITLTDNSNTAPTIVITLTGVGVTLDVTVVPPAIDFGDVVVNTTLGRSVVVTNNGALPLSIAPFSVIGNDAQLFTIQSYNATQAQPLAAGASVTIGVQFAPVLPSTSDYTAAFVLSFCDGCQETTVALRGQGVSSGLQITPDPLNFGFVPVGKTVTQSITVQNVANQTISINGVNLNDSTGAFAAGAGGFPQAPIALAPGAQAVFPIAFDPPSSIQYQASLQLVTTDSDSNPNIPISGFGGGPQINCVPSPLDFGTAAVGAPVTLQVACQNVGTDVLDANNNPIAAAELQIAAAGVTVSGSPAFTAHLDQPPMGLTSGQIAVIDVVYTATAAETDTATLNIASNDTVTPNVAIPLSGQAISLPPCEFTVSPQSLTFGDVSAGQTGVLAFTITNTGTNDCLLSGLSLGPSTDPSFSLQAYPSGLSSLRIGTAGNTNNEPSELTVAVAFAPTVQGNFMGSVEFTLSNPTNPHQSVSLSGSSAPGCLLIAPNDLDFGVVGFNTQNDRWCQTSTRTLNAYNQCNYDVHVTGMTQSDPTDFTVTGFPAASSFPDDVPAESSFSFQVQFTPAAQGEKFGSMLVQTQELAAPYLVDFNGNAQTGVPQTDTFLQANKPQVDILFVLDTDDNGAVEQVVAQNLPAFMNYALSEGIDFQIGVTSTDDCTEELGKLDPCNTQCAVNGNAPLIITPQTQFNGQTDPTGALVNLINQMSMDATGCGDDVFQPAYLALTPPNSSGYNAGFLRQSAYLAIIAIDDGDDASPQSDDFYYNFFESLKGFQNASEFSFNAVDALPSDPSGGCGPVVYDGPGIRIQDMANRTGGLDIDICTQQWGQALTQLGAIAFGSRRSFSLTSTPADPTQITVEICADPQTPSTCIAVPATDTVHNLTNWTYDATTNAVVFDPSDVPLPGQSVVITYPVECQ